MTPPAPPGPPVQSPLTLVMPLKSPDAAAKLKQTLLAGKALMAQALVKQQKTHFARFLFLNDDTEFALLTSYDGDFDPYVEDFVALAAPVLNGLLEGVCNPPPLPVERNQPEFKKYVRAHNVPASVWYSSYPTLTIKDVLANAQRAGFDPGDPTKTRPAQLALTSIMKVNSPAEAQLLRRLMQQSLPSVLKALAAVGTVHFGRFMFLSNETQFAIITAYDGSFDAYIKDFVKYLGPIFDAMLGHVEGGIPLIPVQKNPDAFVKYVNSTNVFPPATWFSAYLSSAL